MTHIRHLSETIGPRGSTTDGEREAADYILDQATRMGLQAKVERFHSATSAYTSYAIALLMALIGVWLYWQPQATIGALAALILNGIFFGALLLEMQFKDNLLRWVQTRDDSQNVELRLPANQASAPPIVITAHLDTHRTPLLFSSRSFLKLFQRLLPIGLGAIVALLALFFIGIFSDARVLRVIALLPTAIVLLTFVLMVEPSFTSYTKGADDNASGVAVALDLAERLRQQPLQQRDVRIVFTGCEEVGAYGADAYISQHRSELNNAIHLVIDQVGGEQADPCFTRSERFLRTVPSDPQLLQLAEQVIAEHPELRAHSRTMNLAYSEISVGARYGLRVIGLGGSTRDGLPPETWHRLTDTIEHINPDAVSRAADAAWYLLQKIDHA